MDASHRPCNSAKINLDNKPYWVLESVTSARIMLSSMLPAWLNQQRSDRYAVEGEEDSRRQNVRKDWDGIFHSAGELDFRQASRGKFMHRPLFVITAGSVAACGALIFASALPAAAATADPGRDDGAVAQMARVSLLVGDCRHPGDVLGHINGHARHNRAHRPDDPVPRSSSTSPRPSAPHQLRRCHGYRLPRH